MKNKLKKKILVFTGALMVAGTLMVTFQGTNAYANGRCIDENTVKPEEKITHNLDFFTCSESGLNVRRGPGINYSKIGWVAFRENF